MTMLGSDAVVRSAGCRLESEARQATIYYPRTTPTPTSPVVFDISTPIPCLSRPRRCNIWSPRVPERRSMAHWPSIYIQKLRLGRLGHLPCDRKVSSVPSFMTSSVTTQAVAGLEVVQVQAGKISCCIGSLSGGLKSSFENNEYGTESHPFGAHSLTHGQSLLVAWSALPGPLSAQTHIITLTVDVSSTHTPSSTKTALWTMIAPSPSCFRLTTALFLNQTPAIPPIANDFRLQPPPTLSPLWAPVRLPDWTPPFKPTERITEEDRPFLASDRQK